MPESVTRRRARSKSRGASAQSRGAKGAQSRGAKGAQSRGAKGAQSRGAKGPHGVKGGRASKGASGAAAAAANKLTDVPLDKKTADALTLFNTYLEADRERRKRERALKKAHKAKKDAASKVRNLTDRRAPSADIAAAESAYRETVEALRLLKKGESKASKTKPG